MRIIIEQEARQLLKDGHSIICQIDSRSHINISDLSDFEVRKKYFEQGVYSKFVLFDDTNFTPLDKNAILITFKEAEDLISTGSSIFYQKSNGIEIETSSMEDLVRLEEARRRSCENYILYWYV